MKNRNITAMLMAITICAGSVGAAVLAPHPERAEASVPLPPMAPRSLWPATTAGSWVYVQYQHDFAVAAYECASGHRLSGFLGSAYQTITCTDWYLVVKAHSQRAQVWHAIDYMKYWHFNYLDWQRFYAILNVWSTWAKNYSQVVGVTAYLSAESASCARLIGVTTTASGEWAGGVVGIACHRAFEKFNPYGRL